MLPRFLAPDARPGRGEVVLPADEAHHLTRVLRLRAGAEVEVFDGAAGYRFAGTVKAIDGGSVTVALDRQLEPPRAPKVPLDFAQAVLKGDKMDDVVRDATMLGVACIRPIVSAHVTLKRQALERGRPAERWRRIALASAKQCGRTTVPIVEEPRRFQEVLDSVQEPAHAGGANDGRRAAFLLVEPSAAPPGTRSMRSLVGEAAPRSAVLFAGPEGGWAAEELQAAIHRAVTPVTLGPLTLRADAVAVAAVSMFRMLWED